MSAYHKSASLFETEAKISSQATALSRAAYVLKLQRKYADSAETVSIAFALLDANDSRREFGHFVYGVIALEHGKLNDAIFHFRKSLDFCQLCNDEPLSAKRRVSLAIALRKAGRYEEALGAFADAKRQFTQLKDPVRQAVCSMNMGNVYRNLEEPETALALYLESETAFRSTNDALHLAMLYVNIGLAYFDMQNWSKAASYLSISISRWQSLGNVRSLVNAIDSLGEVRMASGDYEGAAASFKEALMILDKDDTIDDAVGLQHVVNEHLAKAVSLVSKSNKHK